MLHAVPGRNRTAQVRDRQAPRPAIRGQHSDGERLPARSMHPPTRPIENPLQYKLSMQGVTSSWRGDRAVAQRFLTPSGDSLERGHRSSIREDTSESVPFSPLFAIGERSYHSSSGSSRNTLRTPSLQSALSAVK